MIRNGIGENIDLVRRRFAYNAAVVAAGGSALSSGVALAANRASSKSAGVAAASKPEKRNITLATTSISALPYLPLLVAQQKGFFSRVGLELEISEQQSAARAIASVAAGSSDIVCGWFEHLLSAPGRALGLQSFALFGVAPMMSLGVTASARTNVSSVPAQLMQLKGRKIGVIALNSPTHTVALAVLRRSGLRADDVGFVSVGSAASAAVALRSGQIDALMHMDPLMLELEQRGEITTLCDLRSPAAAYGVLGMHLPSSCIAAPQEFYQRFPVTAQACSDALLMALQWLGQASLRDMLQFHESLPEPMQGMTPQSFVAGFKHLHMAFSTDGVCSLQMAGNLLQVMHDAEPALRLEKIDISKSINISLVQRNRARLAI